MFVLVLCLFVQCMYANWVVCFVYGINNNSIRVYACVLYERE